MKKKWLMLGGAVGISSIVMVTTGFSALASTSGYDAYKSALKNTKTVQNVAVQAAAALQDNGNVLASANGSFKVSLDSKTASGNADVLANGTQQSLSFYKQDNQTVLKSNASDVYFVKQEGDKKHKTEKKLNETEIPQQVETVIDALVGNLKDYVAVDTKTDGTKEISIQLDNAQIPTVVNALAPIAIKEASKDEHDGKQKNAAGQAVATPFNEDFLKNAAPQLTQDIKIEKVSIKASINADNYISHQEADLTVSGKDDSGAAHQVTLHLQADLSGYNQTTPDTVDLTGKTVQNLKHDRHGNHDENE
ncbi:hypothetical protein GCM10008018_63450 [Paenibacillus marchantiophytorum]|uniref:Uncharacterized protein n=1 Tax=Paenibacillus marchantiophytorum TaxID=1619310 RepID=A0ABQ1FGB4_9BACL|nr:hypothetical protein [Paenibacillus marchantiophytorum]GGA09166.1 hypothetical protein GCM10008018_63450 [Paenibacillus marchantiophytorum]